MKEIAVRKSGVVMVDDEDYEYVNQFCWYSDSFHYVFLTKGKEDNFRRVKMHREIMNLHDDMVIDHINRDTFDNRKSNLRICTILENNNNKGNISKNKDKLKGAYKANYGKNKWYSTLCFNKQHIWLGTFNSELEAHNAYVQAKKEHNIICKETSEMGLVC